MKWRLAFAASGLAVLALAAVLDAPLAIRVAIAAPGMLCLVASLAPAYAHEFARAEWLAIAHLVLSVGVALLGGLAAHHLVPPGWHWLGYLGVGATELGYVLLHAKFRRWILFLTYDQWRAIDAETVREPGEAGATSWKLLVILVVCAVSLTLQEYIGDRGAFEHWFGPRGRDPYFELKGYAWWSSWRVIGYVILPLITITLLPRERIADYHVSARGFFKHLWIYLLMFTLILPVVFAASTTVAFRQTYPFYRLANRAPFDLWTWEAFYAAQFVSLEVFFRGFILQGLRRVVGANAIFVMIVPYCMIHYGKPLPETFGAIIAGLILGTLAMRTRSIWGGVLIHVGVAMTMDVLALRGCPPMGSHRGC